MSGQKNPPNRGRKPPDSPDGRIALSSPQYLGRYLVTNPSEGNPEPKSPSVLNPKQHNTQAYPRNIASRLAANIQKGKCGRGQPQNDGTHPVASHLEATSPEPKLERPEVLDPRELQLLACPKIFSTPNPGPTAVCLTVYLLQQVYQKRPALSRRHSTGELPARDKLANTFVMGIPKQRFCIGQGNNSIASAPPVMTAEYCGDPYRRAIKERLAASEPRAPTSSEFAINSRVYHAVGENVKEILELQKGEEPGLMKQVMSIITGMGYAMVAKLRTKMRDRWIGYDEFASFHGHRHAVEHNKLQMKRFFKAAMPPMRLEAAPQKPSLNRQKGRGRGRVSGGCRGGCVQKPWQNPRNDRLRKNIEEARWGREYSCSDVIRVHYHGGGIVVSG